MSEFMPSGEQWTISHGDQQVTVVEIGGGLREYTAGDRPVLFGYPQDAKADAGRGQVLMPWPNRTRDGRWSFRGKDQQLALSEPARSNASHGLVRWSPWSLAEQSATALTVSNTLMPQQGWDYPLELSVRYELTDEGLSVTPSATALGDSAAPFGFGAHPYLTVGEGQVDALELTIPGNRVLTVDERLIPTGQIPVTPDLDFRTGRTVGWTQVDHAYTDLDATDGRWQVTVSRDEHSTTLWADAQAYPYVQVFTGDSLPDAKRRRSGIAVEPMTCPANALATGQSLIVLDAGQTWSAPWGISAT